VAAADLDIFQPQAHQMRLAATVPVEQQVQPLEQQDLLLAQHPIESLVALLVAAAVQLKKEVV
jgi:hypothetical protein